MCDRRSILFAMATFVVGVAACEREAPPREALEGHAEGTTETSAIPGANDIERAYLGAAIGFLDSHNRHATKVATAMGGLESGQVTLGQLRRIISDARSITDAAWQGDYLKDGKLKIPPGYEEVDARIRKSFEMRRAAYTEYLEYWEDQNTAHILSGNATFERSELVAQEAQEQLKLKMKDLEPLE